MSTGRPCCFLLTSTSFKSFKLWYLNGKSLSFVILIHLVRFLFIDCHLSVHNAQGVLLHFLYMKGIGSSAFMYHSSGVQLVSWLSQSQCPLTINICSICVKEYSELETMCIHKHTNFMFIFWSPQESISALLHGLTDPVYYAPTSPHIHAYTYTVWMM